RELQCREAGGAVRGGGDVDRADEVVVSYLEGGLDVTGQRVAGEAVREGRDVLVDAYLAVVGDDPDLQVLLDQLALAGGEAVEVAVGGLGDEGCEGEVELLLRQGHCRLVDAVGQHELTGLHRRHEIGGAVGAAEPVQPVEDLFAGEPGGQVRGGGLRARAAD